MLLGMNLFEMFILEDLEFVICYEVFSCCIKLLIMEYCMVEYFFRLGIRYCGILKFDFGFR